MNEMEGGLPLPWGAVPLSLIAGLFVAGLGVGGTALWAMNEILRNGHDTDTRHADAGPMPVMATNFAAGTVEARPYDLAAHPLPERSHVLTAAPEMADNGSMHGRAGLAEATASRSLGAPDIASRPAEDLQPAPPASKDVCAPELFVRFGNNRSVPQLAPQEPALQSIGLWLDQHPGERLRVEGHADATGTPEGNLILSFRRAAAVKAELLRYGIDRQRIEITALGEQRPIEGVPAASGANRRVTVRVIDHPSCKDPEKLG